MLCLLGSPFFLLATGAVTWGHMSSAKDMGKSHHGAEKPSFGAAGRERRVAMTCVALGGTQLFQTAQPCPCGAPG
jgi:hypothetical protein